MAIAIVHGLIIARRHFRGEPAARGFAAAGRREQIVRQQGLGVERRFGRVRQRRRRIEPAQPRDQRVGRFRRGEIGLGQHQPIGDGDLLGALGLARQLGRTVHRIDRGDDVAQAEMVPEHGVGLHGREDGERVGQAGAFDDQPSKARH